MHIGPELDAERRHSMGTGSAEGYHEGILELERALFAYITAVHRDAGCGADGIHRAECAALLEQLGWDSYDQYLEWMEMGMTARTQTPPCGPAC
jgi:hypothetical protein